MTTHPFTDTDPDRYSATAIQWVWEQGITTGTSPTTFSPDDPVSREQMATFLWRAAGSPTPNHRPPVPPVEPPQPPTPPPTGDVPWTIPDIGEPVTIEVELPEGALGPERSTFTTPPPSVATFDRGVWTFHSNWDEDVQGAALDLGAAEVDLNGHAVFGFRLDVPQGGRFLISGGGGSFAAYFTVSNPGNYGHRAVFEGAIHAYNFSVFGWSGDFGRFGRGDRAMLTDFYAEAWQPSQPQFDSNDIHADGVQCHDGKTNSNGGHCVVRRGVMDWKNSGALRNTTAPIFTQGSAGADVHDMLILNPGGTGETIEWHGTGAGCPDRTTRLGKVQVIGVQVRNEAHGFMAPRAILRYGQPVPDAEIINNVPGALTMVAA